VRRAAAVQQRQQEGELVVRRAAAAQQRQQEGETLVAFWLDPYAPQNLSLLLTCCFDRLPDNCPVVVRPAS